MEEQTNDVVQEERSAFEEVLKEEQTETAPESSPESNETPVEEGDPAPEGDNTQEEARIPYDRFKAVNDENKELKSKLSELDELKEQFSLLQKEQPSQQGSSLPGWWSSVYGDDDISRKAFEGHQRMFAEHKEQMMSEISERQKELQRQEEEATQKWEQVLVESLQDLQDKHGVQFLGETQEASDNRNELYKVLEDYSPKGGEWIPFDKAYEIYEMKRARAELSEGRKKAADLTGPNTKGESKPGPRIIGGWDGEL